MWSDHDVGMHVWAQVFARVPEHVGFDIEVKMTTPISCPRTPQV